MLSEDEIHVYKALGPYPIHIDDLVRKISLEPGKLSGLLLKLELKGVVQQSPGKLFSISENFV
jgi:DNA processing protein